MQTKMHINIPQNRGRSPHKSPSKGGKSPSKQQAFPTTPRSRSIKKKLMLRTLKRMMEHN